MSAIRVSPETADTLKEEIRKLLKGQQFIFTRERLGYQPFILYNLTLHDMEITINQHGGIIRLDGKIWRFNGFVGFTRSKIFFNSEDEMMTIEVQRNG